MTVHLAKIAFGIASILLIAGQLVFAQDSVPIKITGAWTLSEVPERLVPVEFSGEGTGTQLGKWACFGELVFDEGKLPGEVVGVGIVVFEAADGDLLVGEVATRIGADGVGQLDLHWVNTAVLSDGTEVETTGRFLNRRFGGAKILTLQQGLTHVLTGK